MTTTPAELTPDQRARLAEYHVLEAYHLARMGRYGDMARARRDRELNRRGDALLADGVPINRDGEFPPSSRDELVAAWDRVIEPRRRRHERSVQPLTINGQTFDRMTRYARATIEAFELAARRLGFR